MSQELYDAGLAMRKAVLGEDYVNRSMEGADDFNRPFQDYLNEHCWGAVWTRPGLSPRTRSLLNLAMLSALNRGAELELHLRGALNNGVTREEIAEVFIQAALYCGAPAGVESFRIARKVFASIDEAKA